MGRSPVRGSAENQWEGGVGTWYVPTSGGGWVHAPTCRGGPPPLLRVPDLKTWQRCVRKGWGWVHGDVPTSPPPSCPEVGGCTSRAGGVDPPPPLHPLKQYSNVFRKKPGFTKIPGSFFYRAVSFYYRAVLRSPQFFFYRAVGYIFSVLLHFEW